MQLELDIDFCIGFFYTFAEEKWLNSLCRNNGRFLMAGREDGGARWKRERALGLLLERCKREPVGAEMAGPQNTTRDGNVLAFHPSHRLAVTSPPGIVRQAVCLV
jgi:hypothetical protein